MSEKCSSLVSRHREGASRCSRQATVQRGGKWYCFQHDPEALKRKRAEWEADYQAERRTDEENRLSAKELVRALGCGSPAFSTWGKGGYTGGVELTPDEARSLIERLAKAGEPPKKSAGV